ncbi:hypothetical protein Avbf_18656 [Armadillidium vulgare]|nr:hypothetical protein Avbf_18656 [Armadillidium vulgare]
MRLTINALVQKLLAQILLTNAMARFAYILLLQHFVVLMVAEIL